MAKRRLSTGVLAVFAAALAYAVWPAAVPAADFADDLTGPASDHLIIPFAKYALTPEGLLRTHSNSGRENGIDRPVIRTRSDRFGLRDFVLEVDITFPSDVEDIVFIGLGRGTPTTPYNEPGGSFSLRIHHISDTREVRLAAVAAPQDGAQATYRFQQTIGTVPDDGMLTVRLERVGDRIIGSMPGHAGSSTIQISSYPEVPLDVPSVIFLSNTTEGTLFRGVRVRPRT